MKLRTLMTLSVVILMLTMIGACGDSGKGLDMAGLSLGKDLSGVLGNATKLLGGITDLDSAKAALPKLMEMNTGLDDIVAKVKKLSPESLESFAGMAKKALPALEGAMSKLSDIPGVGQTLQPTLDSILSKVKGMM